MPASTPTAWRRSQLHPTEDVTLWAAEHCATNARLKGCLCDAFSITIAYSTDHPSALHCSQLSVAPPSTVHSTSSHTR